MKKMMMALMAIFAVTTAFADDDEFKVVEGSFVDVVRQPGKTATVEFNYLDAQAVEKQGATGLKDIRGGLAAEGEDEKF